MSDSSTSTDLASSLRALLTGLAPGDRLPSSRELTRRYRVGPGTVSRAIATLAAQVAAIDAFASELGVVFQIVDDILDVEGTPEVIGKTPGKDAACGKLTYPALYGIERSRLLAQEGTGRAIAALDAAGIDAWALEVDTGMPRY